MRVKCTVSVARRSAAILRVSPQGDSNRAERAGGLTERIATATRKCLCRARAPFRREIGTIYRHVGDVCKSSRISSISHESRRAAPRTLPSDGGEERTKHVPYFRFL
jgi:hypothetical protein